MGETMKLSHVYNKYGLAEYHKQELCYPWTDVPAFMFWDAPDFDIDNLPESNCPMRTWQDGRCALCGFVDRLVEDHDHKTGMSRGMLCRSCNNLEGRGVENMQLWRDGLTVVAALGIEVEYVHALGFATKKEDVSWEELQSIAAMLD